MQRITVLCGALFYCLAVSLTFAQGVPTDTRSHTVLHPLLNHVRVFATNDDCPACVRWRNDDSSRENRRNIDHTLDSREKITLMVEAVLPIKKLLGNTVTVVYTSHAHTHVPRFNAGNGRKTGISPVIAVSKDEVLFSLTVRYW